MTNSARWVQNSGVTGQWAVKGRLDSPKLRVERQPFLASKVVIFGVIFTGPHILVCKLYFGCVLPLEPGNPCY